MSIPTNSEIIALLNQLENTSADNLETQNLDFKPWTDAKNDMRIAVEYTVCFANTTGGVVVFGVSDRITGRSRAIHGAQGYDIDVWRRGIFDSTRPHILADVEELAVPEGTGHLLVVRVPKGDSPPYGTALGIFKRRVGKNCMPMDPAEFVSYRVSTGAVDWSGQPAHNVSIDDLDPLEVARARSFLRSRNPESELLKMPDYAFLQGLEAIRDDAVTNTGLILFGNPDIIETHCPQNQVHYVHQVSETNVARNDLWRMSLLQIIEKLEGIFSSPANPEEEIPMGLFRLRIPAYPLEVVREAVLNAVTHRDYTNPGEVLIRHSPYELAVTSPGGFIGGINLQNILRHEAVARNRTLANAFLKLRLVESAGTGRRKIFIPMLEYGKRMPQYEADESCVTLRIFDGTFDQAMARLVASWHAKGKDIGMDGLMVLTYLKRHRFITSSDAAALLQLDREEAISVLDRMSHPKRGLLERKGHVRMATYYLTKSVAKDLIGKVAYSSTKGIDPTRYMELVREFVQDHGSITNRECRQLFGLGDSPSAQVEVSRYLRKWSGPDGFLIPEGRSSQRKYRLRSS
ncbi:MAG: putative DNA binding domain-containing protein [Methanomicrobiales archaeon]|nr:putative DNA binding domain-containing protein [Methanomicrobiales archaeon]